MTISTILPEDVKKKGKKDYENIRCCICGSDKTDKNYGGKPLWLKHPCNNKGCMGICNKCYSMTRRDSDWKKGDLDPLSATGKGFIGQQIVAQTYNVEDCNIKMNNFRFYVDISKISGYGYCEVKIRSFDILQGKYEQWLFDTRREQDYDTLLTLCMDRNKPWKDVEEVYAFPWETVIYRNKANITITRNSLNKDHWYDEFKIDEKPFNEKYHNLKLENCKVLRKDNKVK